MDQSATTPSAAPATNTPPTQTQAPMGQQVSPQAPQTTPVQTPVTQPVQPSPAQPVPTQPAAPRKLPPVDQAPSNPPSKSRFSIPKFVITKKEIFLFIATVLLLLALILQIPISVFNAYDLLLITIMTFLAKGFFSDMKDTPLYYVFLLGIFFTLYFPIFQVLLIYIIATILFKVLKVV